MDSVTVNMLETVNYKDTIMMSEKRTQIIQSHTVKDETLKALYKVIKSEWPTSRAAASILVRTFFNYGDELHAEEKLIFKGNRLVVPVSLQKQFLDITHQGHVGLEGCLRCMREALFWPGMSADLKALLRQCDACLR